MIRQLSHIIEECPVCGRPVEIRCEYLGRQVVCQHCGGRFVVSEQGTQAPEWMPKFRRLTEAADRGPFYEEPAGDHASLADSDCPRILLVEHRDEVFVRLAADMAEKGRRVIRATTAYEAVKHYAKQPFTLVIANLDLPDQSGWLLAAKLHLVDPTAAIWLYEPAWSNRHAAMAKFLRVDALFAHGGDLLGLADTVAARLAERFEDRKSTRLNSSHIPLSRMPSSA